MYFQCICKVFFNTLVKYFIIFRGYLSCKMNMVPLLKYFSLFQCQTLYVQPVHWDLKTLAFVESGKNKNLKKNSRCNTGERWEN